MKLGHRVAPELGDRPGARAALFVGEVRPQDLGLDDDQAEGVCDHVVELTGDPNALLGDGSLGLERLLPLLEGGPLARALTANPGVEAQPGRGDRADQHGRQAVVTGRTPCEALQHERRDDADRGDRRLAPTERDRDRVQRHQRRAKQEQDRGRRDDRGNDSEQSHQRLSVTQHQRRQRRPRSRTRPPATGRTCCGPLPGSLRHARARSCLRRARRRSRAGRARAPDRPASALDVAGVRPRSRMGRRYAPISRPASSDRRDPPRRADEIARQNPARVALGFTRRPDVRRGRRPYLRENNSET